MDPVARRPRLSRDVVRPWAVVVASGDVVSRSVTSGFRGHAADEQQVVREVGVVELKSSALSGGMNPARGVEGLSFTTGIIAPFPWPRQNVGNPLLTAR